MPELRTRLAVVVCIALAAGGQAWAGDGPRRDCFGDALPPGVLVRLGTERFGHCYCAAISPDGKVVATGDHEVVYLWDADTGKELRRLPFPDRSVHGLVFSPDGQKLAVLDFSGTVIDLWDLKTLQRKTLRQGGFGGGSDWTAAAVFSPDGKTLYAATADAIFHWDTTSGKKVKELAFRRDNRPCRAAIVVFAPDGKIVATDTYYDKGKLFLWDVQTGAFKYPIQGFKTYSPFRFSPDGTMLASGGGVNSWEPHLDLWEVATGKRRHSIPVAGSVEFLAFSPDGKTLASAHRDYRSNQRTVQFRELAAPDKPARSFPATGVNSVQFAPDGKTIAWQCCGQSVRFLDRSTGAELKSFATHRGAIRSVVFSRDGKTVASGSEDGTARLWDAATGRQLRAFHGHPASVNAVALSPDGKWLASASGDHTAIVWGLADGKKQAILEKHGNEVLAAVFSPDGKLLATGGAGPCILWDPVGGKKLYEGDFQGGSLVFTPDAKVLAAATAPHARGGVVLLLDVAKKTKRKLSFEKYITSLAISADGTTLAVGCEEKVFVVDVASGKTRRTLPGHHNWRGCVAFSPDARYLASGGDGYGRANPHKRTQIFELLTGTEIYHFNKGPVIYSMDFSPDGTRLIAGSDDTTALIWDLKNLSGKQRRASLSPKELAACWQALAQPDAKDAYEARVDLLHAPASAVPFLAKHLSPTPALDGKHVAQLIDDLGHPQFKRRDQARRELEQLAELVEEPLRKALSGTRPLETRRRIESLLARLDGPVPPARFREYRAIEILEGMGTPAAVQLLARLAQGNAAGLLTRQAQAALERQKKAAAVQTP